MRISVTAVVIGIAAQWLLAAAWGRWAARRQQRVLGEATYRACMSATRDIGRWAGRVRRLRWMKWLPLAVIAYLLVTRRELGPLALAGIEALFLTTLGQWVREQIPASILILGASRDEQILLQARLHDAVLPFRPVSLLQNETITTKIPGDCFRIDSGRDWHDAVFGFCKALPFIVLDVRHMTGFVRDEINHVVAERYLYKTLFVGAGDATLVPAGPIAAVADEEAAIRLMRYVLFQLEMAPGPDRPMATLLAGWRDGAVRPSADVAGAPAGDGAPGRRVEVELPGLAPFSYEPPDGWQSEVLVSKPGSYVLLCRPPDETSFFRRRSRLDFMVFEYPQPALPDEDQFRRATEVNLRSRGATITAERLAVRCGARSHECDFQQGTTVGCLVRFIVGRNEYLVHWTSVEAARMTRFRPVFETFVERIRDRSALAVIP